MLLSPGLVSRAARTDPNGELLLRLAPDAYAFAATAKEFQITTATKTIGREATVDLTLARAALVRGRVRRGDTGVPGVHINVLGSPRIRRENMTITNDKGEFEIGGLAPGAYRLGVFKADELIERTLEIEAPADVDIPLPPAGTIRGRVIDGTTGAPVTEIVYSVEPVSPEPGTRMGRGIHRGEQNADGRFVVTVPAGTYRVSASANGFTPAEPLEVRVDAREPATVDIPLSRGVIITGRVTDESGLPVSEADVMVLDAESLRGRTQRTRVAPGHGRTDADGSFTVSGVRAGEASLTVRKPGFVPFRKTLDAETTMSVDVQLAKGLTVRGIVTRGGKPVADAQISASTSAVGGEHQPATSDDDGRFVLSGLVAARYTIGAFLESDHAEVRDIDPTRQKEITISLDPKPRGVVYGTVSGIPATGGKIVRRTVIVQGQSGSAEGSIDEAGNYRIEDAPTGQVQVSAMVELAPRGMRGVGGPAIELVAGQPQRVDLDLSGNVAVTGRVTQSGKPIAGAHVSFGTDRGTMVAVVTREDGAYDIALPEAGRYTINVSAEQLYDRAYTSVRDVRGGERIDVDLRELTLDGVVLDATTRLPIPTAFVTLTPSAATAVMPIVAEVPVAPNGTFRIATTSTGPYRLIASAQGYAHKVLPVSQASSQHTLELTPVAEFRVRVLDAATRSALDAHITLHESDGAYVPARPVRSVDGTTYAFSLAPGKYRLTVIAQGYQYRTMEVTAPGTMDVLME
jgi:hypothetical protein